MLINLEGEQKELSWFERDNDTEAFNSCSINWKNQLHIFGGYKEKRQISRLSGYRLERIGSLAFDHYMGACSVMANKFIFLCFSFHSHEQCWRSTGPLETFSAVALSNHKHSYTQISCSESKSSCQFRIKVFKLHWLR